MKKLIYIATTVSLLTLFACKKRKKQNRSSYTELHGDISPPWRTKQTSLPKFPQPLPKPQQSLFNLVLPMCGLALSWFNLREPQFNLRGTQFNLRWLQFNLRELQFKVRESLSNLRLWLSGHENSVFNSKSIISNQ